MHEALAQDVLHDLLQVHHVLGMALSAAGDPASWDDDTRQLTRALASAIGTIYTDLMVPIIRQHPALDPDREGAPVRTVTQDVAAASLDVVSRSESVAQSSMRACDASLELLRCHEHVVLGGRGREASRRLGELARESVRELRDARDLARRLCECDE